MHSHGRRVLVALTVSFLGATYLLGANAALAAPRIANVSLRGVQAGGVTTLVIEGNELAPEPHVWFTAPGVKATVKEGATAKRLEVELALPNPTPPGIYYLRIGSTKGISEAVALGVDNLPQLAFADTLPQPNVALTGALEGSQVLSTKFTGSRGQRVVAEVEARRIGSKLEPVVHLYDARRVQVAWSQGFPALAGDARLVATLPADGEYTIEVHDAVFRGERPGFFRLKIGDLQFADVAYPLAVQQGVSTSFEFAGTSLPAKARATGSWTIADGRPQLVQPAPWPAEFGPLTGSRPAVLVTNHAEIVEPLAGEKAPDLAAAPVAINGRISAPGEQDRYQLAVVPGQKLAFDVLARRAGSPLDGVLSIQNLQGGELAGNDDRPGTSDPGLEFTVPDGVTAVAVALRDLESRGGADYVYRIAVTPAGAPGYSLTLDDDRYLVPIDGAGLVRVRIERSGYDGPVTLKFDNLPSGATVSNNEIPAGATQALVTLSAPGAKPAQALSTITGTSTAPNTAIHRLASPPRDVVSKHQPWLADEVAVGITEPGRLQVAWEMPSDAMPLVAGVTLPLKVKITRAEGVTGPVKLSLLTTQVMPRKKEKVNNVDRDVDDVERSLRLEKETIVPADAVEAQLAVLVPGDLPLLNYDLAVQAELPGPDNKKVLAESVTPAVRRATVTPIGVELAVAGPVAARAGVGPAGKIIGSVRRAAGVAVPLQVSLAGLPPKFVSPSVVVPADKSDFELALAFPFGLPAGDLAGVKLVAAPAVDAKDPLAKLPVGETAVAIRVVTGAKPPAEKPLVIFEDQVEFLAQLNQGGGQASLIADAKFSGLASIRVTPDQRFNPALAGLNVRIREFPGPGEFRYLQYAWKKQGGQSICLQLNHDGQWGPVEKNPAKFRYHAGPTEVYGASVAVDDKLPAEFTLVTRDLFADFGEFTLNGLALAAVDGEFGLWDHISLGTKPEDFELNKP